MLSKFVGGSGGIATKFLKSALDGDEWLASCPGRFNPQRKLRYLLDMRLVGPQSRSELCGIEKKIFLLPQNEPIAFGMCTDLSRLPLRERYRHKIKKIANRVTENYESKLKPSLKWGLRVARNGNEEHT
jgi:hypothetical protein